MEYLYRVLFFCVILSFPFHLPAQQIPVTGPEVPELEVFDEAMLWLFNEIEGLPGAVLALSHEGRLVYIRGFGLADVENEVPVDPFHRFRIASITKPITSAAIFSLIEQGKLSLDEKLFDIIDLPDLHDEAGDAGLDDLIADERVLDITVSDLLNHLGGWDRNQTPDPFFINQRNIASQLDVSSPPDVKLTLLYTLAEHTLDFSPGTGYAYSNIGYNYLGQVIEKVSGKKYEEYIRELLRAPDIDQLRMGDTRASFPNEARYYTNKSDTWSIFDEDGSIRVPRPYGSSFSVETLHAAGGLIASATDLLKFENALHGDRPPFLAEQTVEEIFTMPEFFEEPPPVKIAPYSQLPAVFSEDETENRFYYANGWLVSESADEVYTYHDGSLPGTSTFMIRSGSKNLTAVILTNVRFGFNTEQNNRFLQNKQSSLLNAILEVDVSDIPLHDYYAPQPVAPEHEMLISSEKVEFEWENHPSADLVSLQIATDSLFENIILEEEFSDNTHSMELEPGQMYFWRVGPVHGGEKTDWSNVQKFETATDAGSLAADHPAQMRLHQNYPNPFNPATNIAFTLPVQSEVKLEVFDVIGRRVAVLADEVKPAGENLVKFDATGFSAGVYMYRLTVDGRRLTQTMMLIK